MNQDVTNCPACSRRTPAARARCMYCGEMLPVTKIETAPAQRILESYESAFNVVLEPRLSHLDANSETRFASALQIELHEAQSFIAANKRIPVARCQNRQEAELISALINTCGVGCTVVADEDLRLQTNLIRARKIIVVGDNLNIRHSGGEIVVPLAEIKLMVLGSLKNTQVQYAETLGSNSRNSAGVIDTAEFYSDESLLDIYATSLGKSCRIKAGGFDYSGLVAPLAFRVEANFQAALQGLQYVAKSATYDSDFTRIKSLLARAWPERSRTESRGVKRGGIGFKAVTQSSIISDNRDQFERYSRLMFLAVEENRIDRS